MDEVFGADNFRSVITFRKTAAVSSPDARLNSLAAMGDYLVWYAKDASKMRYSQIFLSKGDSEKATAQYGLTELPNGEVRRLDDSDDQNGVALQSVSMESNGYAEKFHYDLNYAGKLFKPGPTRHWSSTEAGLKRVTAAERVLATENKIRFKKLLEDFPVTPLGNMWNDLMGASDAIYVVQTNTSVLDRCILMTTDPGDLVLDPTCGSGTTAFVAEKWGRRWITCDTSRVALALAKQRLMTASFEHFKLRLLNPDDLSRNPRGAWLRNGTAEPRTFQCKSVPHITLKSIARNTALDPIFARHQPLLDECLVALNTALKTATPALKQKLAAKLVRKHREDGASAVTEADQRRWLLPGTHPAAITETKVVKPLKALTGKQATAYRNAIPAAAWQPWQVPFDSDADWPAALAETLAAYRAAWRAKMDAVNACIAAHAELEELVDQPETVPGVVRVAGPFTMEGVIAMEQGPGTASDAPIGGAPEALDSFGSGPDEADNAPGAIASVNAEAHLDKMLRLLKAAGVDFANNRCRHFDRLDPCSSPGMIHAEGVWLSDLDKRVAISIGPEVGNITAWQVEDAVRSANRAGYDEVVFAGFGFDASAQAVIDEASHPRLLLHMALIRPDVAMGELLKTQPGSQLFMVFSAPRVAPPKRQADGQWTLEMQGMDVYDPVNNALHPTSRDRIAAWFVDTDYDGRCFCICQAFFPDRKKWDKLARALGDRGVVDESRFDELTGFESLPFARPPKLQAGQPWRVGVKVIDPRGNEGLRVITLPAD